MAAGFVVGLTTDAGGGALRLAIIAAAPMAQTAMMTVATPRGSLRKSALIVAGRP